MTSAKSKDQDCRRGPNRWPKGVSGNPSGRPKVVAEVRDLARAYGAEAIARLVTLMRTADREQTRLEAAQALLDRGYGRVAQTVHATQVNNFNVPAPGLGQLEPAVAYRLMIEGAIPADGEHPAFHPRPAIEHQAETVDTGSPGAPLEPGGSES